MARALFPISFEQAIENCVRINLPEAARAKAQLEGGVPLEIAENGKLVFHSGENEVIPLDMDKISECKEALESYKEGGLKEYLLEHVMFGNPDSIRELFESLDDRMALMAITLIQSYGGILLLIIQFLLDGKTELVNKLCVDTVAEVSKRRSENLQDTLLKKLGEAAKDGRHDQVLDYLMRLCCMHLVLPMH